MIYEIDNIRIRPWKEQDMGIDYENWFNDSEVTKWNSHGRFPIRQKDKDYVIESMNSNNLWWGIEQRTTNLYNYFICHYILIGNIVLFNIDFKNRTAELAILIGNKDYWKKGIGEKVCKFVLEHGFIVLGLHTIYLGTPAPNIGMRKLAIKIGMTPVGKRRQAIYLNGCFYDIIYYDILRENFIRERE